MQRAIVRHLRPLPGSLSAADVSRLPHGPSAPHQSSLPSVNRAAPLWPPNPSARNVGTITQIEAPGAVGGAGAPDPGAGGKAPPFGTAGGDVQRRSGEIPAVMLAGNGHRLGEPSRTGCDQPQVGRTAQGDPSPPGHQGDTLDRLQSPEQDGRSLSLSISNNVHAVVVTVGEVDIGEAGRAGHDATAWRQSVGVAGRGVRPPACPPPPSPSAGAGPRGP